MWLQQLSSKLKSMSLKLVGIHFEVSVDWDEIKWLAKMNKQMIAVFTQNTRAIIPDYTA